MKTESQTYRVEFTCGDAHEINVEVPVGTTRDAAFILFCDAAGKHLGLTNQGFVLSKCDREYDGCGGMFQTYLMPKDQSGSILAEVWFEASVS